MIPLLFPMCLCRKPKAIVAKSRLLLLLPLASSFGEAAVQLWTKLERLLTPYPV